MSDTWLIVIDPQVIFASPTSSWGSPAFPDIIEPINRMVAAFRGRTIVTRWSTAGPLQIAPQMTRYLTLSTRLRHGRNARRSTSPPSVNGELNCQQ